MKRYALFLAPMLALATIGCAQQKPDNLPPGAYTGVRWSVAAAKLTKDERDKLSEVTDGCGCGHSVWNDSTLRWEEEFYGQPERKGKLGPRAILPLSLAISWPKVLRDREDAKADAERKEGTKGSRFTTWEGKEFFSEYLMGGTGILYSGPVIWHSGKWAPDEEQIALEKAAAAEAEVRRKHVADLWVRLRSRPITDAEMSEVMGIGSSIVPFEDGGFEDFRDGETVTGNPDTILQQRRATAAMVFQNALENQFKMRSVESRAK